MEEISKVKKKIEEAIKFQSGSLNLNGCDLTDDSYELTLLSDCTFLEELILSNNHFTHIPTHLPNSLKILILTNCNIQKIENLDGFINLFYLDVSKNKIQKIENLDKLFTLTYLDFSNNQIQKIEHLEHLTELSYLYLSGNPIEGVEPTYLIHNSISFVKDYLSKKNRWKTKLEEEIKSKSGFLDLTNCGLESIPIEIADMTWLNELYLSENNISKIEHLNKLIKLKTLKLYRNKIAIIENLETLVNLNYLTLRENQITEATGLEKLVNLTRLNLSNNQIRSIQPILELISKKHIKTISVEHSYNTEEKGIFLAENPIAEPPKEKIIEGKKAIQQFFAESIKYGKASLDIIKVILVGNSNVGKSDLSRFLRKQPISKEHRSTQVLDIQPWITDLDINGKNSTVKIYLYDFGGQDYYHDAHRMYYSEDTAYILLWDTECNKFNEKIEKGNAENNTMDILYDDYPIPYWLESIKYNLESKKKELLKINPNATNDLKTSLAPILVLQNKIDIAEGSINQEKLKRDFPNIWGFYSVSLRERKRTRTLEEVILDFIQSHKIVGRELIKYEYVIFNYFIENKEELQIYTVDEFTVQCRIIIDDNSIPFDKIKAITIAKMLNNSGLIYFDEINSVIYSNVLEFNSSIKNVMQLAKEGSDKGLFSLNQLKATEKVKYSEQITRLLCKNNSIIELNTDEYVAPQFLSTKPDQNISFFLNAFKYNSIRYLYPAYFHKSILLNLFAKYIVKNDTDSTTTKLNYYPFWRNGILIRKKINDVEETVLVEFEKTPEHGIIKIKTMKPFSKNGLEHEVETVIDDLNRGWTVNKEISVDSQTFFNLDELNRQAANGIYEFAASEEISETKTSKKFGINDFKHLAEFENLPARIFISYSSKNTDYIHRFITHLEVLKSNNSIDYWYDRKIEPGTKWDDSIKEEMSKADIFIFMLSPDFLANKYIFEFELPQAIEQFNNSISKLFFVELQPCGWQRTLIREYQQTVNKDGSNKDIEIVGEYNNDKAWNKIIDHLEDSIQKLKKENRNSQILSM